MGVARNRNELVTQLKKHNDEITIVGDYANTVFSKYASVFSVDPMRNLVGGRLLYRSTIFYLCLLCEKG